MHEAGLARAIAEELRERSLTARDVRLLVRDVHDAADAFDASLRAHLALELPGTDGDIEIVHLASPRLCAACGRAFEAPDAATPCPDCGGTSLPVRLREQVEIEVR